MRHDTEENLFNSSFRDQFYYIFKNNEFYSIVQFMSKNPLSLKNMVLKRKKESNGKPEPHSFVFEERRNRDDRYKNEQLDKRESSFFHHLFPRKRNFLIHTD